MERTDNETRKIKQSQSQPSPHKAINRCTNQCKKYQSEDLLPKIIKCPRFQDGDDAFFKHASLSFRIAFRVRPWGWLVFLVVTSREHPCTEDAPTLATLRKLILLLSSSLQKSDRLPALYTAEKCMRMRDDVTRCIATDTVYSVLEQRYGKQRRNPLPAETNRGRTQLVHAYTFPLCRHSVRF